MTDEPVKPRKGLFLCTRTSHYLEDEKPCDEAFKVTVIDDFARVFCSRYATKEAWAVEIPSIEDFVDLHGPCVVDVNKDGIYTIEIYDTHRE